MTRIEPDPTQPMQPDKSLGDLFGDLTQEFSELVHAQTELAKTEIRTQADKSSRVTTGTPSRFLVPIRWPRGVPLPLRFGVSCRRPTRLPYSSVSEVCSPFP